MTSPVISAGDFLWLDLVDPSPEELAEIARRHGLHPTSVQDCLDPKHLPKHERIGQVSFTILRAYDEGCQGTADTVQELTRKIAIFVSPTFAITVHRKEQPFLTAFRERWRGMDSRELGPDAGKRLLVDLIREVVSTFERPVDRELDELDRFEKGIFGVEGATKIPLEDGYYLKRRASVIRRIIQLTTDAINKICEGSTSAPGSPELQDIRDKISSLMFHTDGIQESTHQLLNLDLAMSSYKTNEVMRVLTVFSLFFLPLNLIAGIYGMNFEHMPELKWAHGYPVALALMATISTGTWLWFRKKGWLR